MPPKIGKLQREIAERLWLLRIRLFGNASEMARSVKLTPQRWYNYETGRRALDAEIAAVVVEECGVDFNWIYGGDEKGLKKSMLKRLKGDPSQPPPVLKRARRKRRTRTAKPKMPRAEQADGAAAASFV